MVAAGFQIRSRSTFLLYRALFLLSLCSYCAYILFEILSLNKTNVKKKRTNQDSEKKTFFKINSSLKYSSLLALAPARSRRL